MTLDDLIVRLTLDVTGFTAGQKAATDSLGKTKDEAVKSGNAIERSAVSASQGVEKLARQFLGLYALLTGGRELKQFLSDITAADAAVGRTAKNIDMSGKALSTWQGVAVAAGGSAEGITGSMAGLSNAMQVAALTGENKLAPVFRALGINLATTGGKARDVGAIMFDLNRRYNEMHLDPARFSAMMKMVGMDDGTINLLERSQSEFRKLYTEQQKYAATAEDIDAAQKRQTGWRELILTSSSLGRTIATALTPVMVDAMKGVQGWASANQEWIKSAIVEKVGEFVTWLRSLDWNAIGKGAQEFGREVVGIATALRDTAKEVGTDSALFKAFEVFGALLLGSKVLGAINTVTGAVTAFGRLPVPPLLGSLLLNPAVLGTAAVGAVLASGDPNKSVLAGGRPDVQPQDNDLGLPGVGEDRPSDTSDAQAKASGAWAWLKAKAKELGYGDRLPKDPSEALATPLPPERPAPAYSGPGEDGNALHRNDEAPAGQQGGFLSALKRLMGFGDDPRVREDISDTERNTRETRDILKRQADAAVLGGPASGVTTSSGGIGGSGRHSDGSSAPGARVADHGQAGRGGGPSSLRSAQQKQNSAAIADELRKAGAPDEGTAAVLGSMQTESSFNPRAHNDVNGGHTGLWQWDSRRWPKVRAWIEKQGGDPWDARWQTKAYIAEGKAKPGDDIFDNAETSGGFRDVMDSKGNLPKAVHGVQRSERFGRGEEGGRAAHASKWLGNLPGAPSGSSASAEASSAPVPSATPTTGPSETDYKAAQARLDALQAPGHHMTDAEHAQLGKDSQIVDAHWAAVRAAGVPPMPHVAEQDFGVKPGPEVKDGKGRLHNRGHMETYDTKGPSGPISTTDYRDPRFAPHPLDPARQKLADAMRAGSSGTPVTPHHASVHHLLQQVLGAIHRADRLTRHDGKPLPVVDKDSMKLHEHTFGKFIGWGKRHPDQLDNARAVLHGSRAALDYHRTVMAGSNMHHSSVTHTAHHYDYSTDTKIGSIAVHTQAKDARQVADDLRPYLFQGRDARQANRGLA